MSDRNGVVLMSRVGTQRVQHLLHEVHARQRLDEDDAADGRVPQKRQPLAARVEQLAIEARLVGRLELRQVEVDALAAIGLRAAGVEQRQGGAEDGRVHRGVVDAHVGFVQVHAALTMHEERQLARRDLVFALALGVVEIELATHRGQPVDGGAHGVDESVAARVLVVVEVALGALALRTGVERVDEHRGDRAWSGDLDARLLELVGNGRHLPVAGGRLARRQRRRAAARVRVGEQPRAVGAQLQRARVQAIVERGQELVEGRREQPLGALDRLESYA